jgi:hypothetical protein
MIKIFGIKFVYLLFVTAIPLLWTSCASAVDEENPPIEIMDKKELQLLEKSLDINDEGSVGKVLKKIQVEESIEEKNQGSPMAPIGLPGAAPAAATRKMNQMILKIEGKTSQSKKMPSTSASEIRSGSDDNTNTMGKFDEEKQESNDSDETAPKRGGTVITTNN